MPADPQLINQVEKETWRPHWLVPVGTAVALITCITLLTLLYGFRPALDAWLHDLHSGGLAGTSNTPDRINGIRIVAGFSAMMTAVGFAILRHAKRQHQRLLAALQGADGVVWIYRELSQVAQQEEHVLVFGLDGGHKLRVTLPTATADSLWEQAVNAFPAVSQGHDVQQERRFATRPELMTARPRVVSGIQALNGRFRAR